MKKTVLAISLNLCAASLQAQDSQTDYNFLRLPVSAHVAALGGDNVSIIEDDPTLIFHNPSLITSVADKSMNLNFMTYMEGVKTASASFVKALGDKATWGVAAQYMDYGSMKQYSEDQIEEGSFSAKDIMVGGTFAYTLSDKFAGGVTAKFITSSIAGYSSLAVGVDLGLNYYNEDLDLSVSAVARNLGGQVKAFDDNFERIPFDLQFGVSQKLGHSPLRLSLTMDHLNDWSDSFIRHVVAGIDVKLSETIYLAAGYNFRRAQEMKISDSDKGSSHGAGLSFGGGLQLERFKLQVAYAKYHVSSSSLIINATYTL